ncbi:hypothetical protein OJF2_77920 [Aquisphaera giovannonii]|uniref:Sulfatase n=1 Tax=Aquisphaera giovannonii TaxID=406548 RepID=A0A5B9WH68_9BACT|nr:DUF1501 domain-containing protein [Aquisphaera giovannonii]QEH39180.1 hypothetical protein OJF2_77920 [Aquisphaera giovannonii]
MFHLESGSVRDCDGVSRREFLRVGGLGLAGLSLADMLRAEGRAAATPSGTKAKGRGQAPARSVILLWMQGGASHIDTFDPKPEAPAEVRGEFGVIPTALPGVQICEHLPRMAQHLDRTTVIRSGYSYNAGHGIADAYMLSGWRFSPATVYPSMGSVVARELPANPGMPPYMQLGIYVDQKTGGGLAGYVGGEHNPFVMTSDPNARKFSVDGITLPGGLTADRFARRRRMLDRFDRWQQTVEAQAGESLAMDRFYEKAFGIVTSPQAKRAFDLSEEDATLRDRYGRNTFGQSCLLARRLVEAGVRFVTVSSGGWDTHQNNFTSLRKNLLPHLDAGYSALLADLDQRGLLEETIVVWMGDFGRTPKINSAAGRDHWAGSMTFCLGGGGIRVGEVLGKSDRNAEQPTTKMVQAEDIAATVFDRLGIPMDTRYVAPDGRPFPVNPGGRVLEELCA